MSTAWTALVNSHEDSSWQELVKVVKQTLLEGGRLDGLLYELEQLSPSTRRDCILTLEKEGLWNKIVPANVSTSAEDSVTLQYALIQELEKQFKAASDASLEADKEFRAAMEKQHLARLRVKGAAYALSLARQKLAWTEEGK